jgi:hypothetical protein
MIDSRFKTGWKASTGVGRLSCLANVNNRRDQEKRNDFAVRGVALAAT